LLAIVGSAPPSSSAFTIPPRPLQQAHYSAVWPLRLRRSMVTLPLGWPSSERTTSRWPYQVAMIKGVEPSSMAMVGSAPLASAAAPRGCGQHSTQK
jgi:hypothetical protein